MSEEDDLLDIYSELDRQEEKENIRETYLKAPFGYPGGKSRSIEQLLKLLPYYDSYVEVFGGSGVVLLSREKSKLEVFNDRYSGVTDFYKVIRNQELLPSFLERIDLTIHSREEFIDCKKTWENVADPVERAARWFYMVVYSFGGQGRNFGRSAYNSNGLSGKLREKIPMFGPIHQRLKNVLIENQDWRQIIKDFDKENTVFYLDPPYYEAYRGTYKHEPTKAEHKEMLDIVFDCKGYVAVSSYENELYNSYSWDDVHSWESFVSTKKAAFRETNHSIGQEQSERYFAKEMLYVKEGK